MLARILQIRFGKTYKLERLLFIWKPLLISFVAYIQLIVLTAVLWAK